MRRWSLCFWVCLGVLGLHATHGEAAHAQAVPLAPSNPTAPEVERARENFVRGLEHSREGRFTHAALAFEDAYLRSGNPVALFNCASALREAGQSARALALVNALFERHAAQLDAETKASAERLRELTAGRLSLEGVPEGARITIDGVEPGPTALGSFFLTPGEHRVEVLTPDGRRASASGALVAGESARWKLTLAEGEAPASREVRSEPSASPRAPEAPRKDERAGFRRRMLWIGAAALVVVGAGLATGLALRSDSEPLRPPPEASAVFRMP